MQPASSNYLKGAVCGFAAVSIWASWSVITRLAVTTSLDAWDIVALRFGVAGVLMAPILMQRGLARDRLGWRGLAVIIAGTGAPYALVAAVGLRFAPASDGGALNPGCMPLFVALIAALVSGREAFERAKVGALADIGWRSDYRRLARRSLEPLGDALFLFAAFLTACFTVVMRQAKLDPLHVAALVSTGSLVIYLPIYLALHGTCLAQLPLGEITVQAIFQGVLVSIVSLLLYGRAVAILGASGGAAFGALVPALSALLAIPLLDEWPNEIDWVGILLISAGVYLASGGPLPSRKPQAAGACTLSPIPTGYRNPTGTGVNRLNRRSGSSGSNGQS
jgi:drug/metabolite transporter (DMT)-like permease